MCVCVCVCMHMCGIYVEVYVDVYVRTHAIVLSLDALKPQIMDNIILVTTLLFGLFWNVLDFFFFFVQCPGNVLEFCSKLSWKN